MNKKRFIFFIVFFAGLFSLSAQSHIIDSLKQALKGEKEDTNKINTLNILSDKLSRISEYDSSLRYANNALTLAAKLGFEKGKGSALNNIGACYNYQGDYNGSIKNYQEGLAVFQKIGRKKGIASSLNGIGLDYIGISDYPKALEYLLDALAVNQQMGDKRGIGICFNNIGNVYKWEKNNSQALEYYLKALNIFQELDFKNGLSNCLMNIGNCYNVEDNKPKALEYYFKSLDIFQGMEDKEGVAFVLGNIANIYAEQDNYPKALEYGLKSLAINEKTGDMPEYGRGLSFVGYLYAKQKKYADSKKYLDSALNVSRKTGEKEIIEEVYENLAMLDSAKGNYRKGWEDYENSIAYKDSLINEATIKKTTQAEMNYEFTLKTDSSKAAQGIRDAIAAKDRQRQMVIRNAFIAGFGLMFLASGVFFTQRRRIAKEKKRSDELLLNILPAETAEELKATGEAKAKSFDMVTVMFTDFKEFTKIAEKLSPAELVAELHYLFENFDKIIQKNNIEKIKTIGDSYMAAGGLPVPNQTNPRDVINAALEIQQFMMKYSIKRASENKPVFEARVGINTGPVVAGIVGIKKFAYDIWGDTVNLASRLESNGEVGKVNISGSTYELVKNDFKCTYRGKIYAKNKGDTDMYFVDGI